VCLIPQLANARRFKVDVSPYPTLVRIEARAMPLPASRRQRRRASPTPK